MNLSRRAALKAFGAAALGLGAAARHPLHAEAPQAPARVCGLYGGRVPIEYDETLSFNDLYHNPPMLGRAEGGRLRVVSSPDRYDEVQRWIGYGDVLPIYGAVRAEPRAGYAHNDVWFDVGQGFIHSSWIVPCREVYNEPLEVPEGGFWGEISVPTSWQHLGPDLCTMRFYDLAYGSVHRVIARAEDAEGRSWYRLQDEDDPQSRWWVQAAHVRPILPAEFSPISPQVDPSAKHILVNLREQRLWCYEADRLVFSTRIASGTTWLDSKGVAHDFHTPPGEHAIIMKRASRHMTGGADQADRYDLPGVPWCTFITWSGVAIHGTYWHNDFGHKRSHGCINVTNDAARWIFLWTTPVVAHDEYRFTITDPDFDSATKVTIVNG